MRYISKRLDKSNNVSVGMATHLLAYAIFSEYIPLANTSTSVVTLTKRRLLAM